MKHANRLIKWDKTPDELSEYADLISPRHISSAGKVIDGPMLINSTNWQMKWAISIGFTTFIESLGENLNFKWRKSRFWSGYWDEKTSNNEESGFCREFPHTHGWPNGSIAVSIILRSPVEGGNNCLWIRNKGQSREKILETPPVPGTGTLILGQEQHGVRCVYGPKPRVTLIGALVS